MIKKTQRRFPRPFRKWPSLLPCLFLFCIIMNSGWFPGIATAEENYRFIRMWPALQQPWYFSYPYDIATDSRGYVYVADQNNDRILKFTSEGQFVGQWNAAQVSSIAADNTDHIYFIVANMIWKYSSDGQFVQKWGLNDLSSYSFSAVETDSNGFVYVTDSYNHCIHVFTGEGKFIGRWGNEGSGDGQFLSPLGIAADKNGNVYVTDARNHCVQKFQTEIRNGILTARFVSRWGTQGKADGQFDVPIGICTDSTYVYVIDQKNDRVQKFDFNGTFISKWGKEGSGDEDFYAPTGITGDKDGYIYVADANQNRIQKFTTRGEFAANWESRGSRDGFFEMPSGISLQETAEEAFLFVADKNNDRIQKFDKNSQHKLTWDKTESGEYLFNTPFDIAVNSSFAYVADNARNRILKFDLNGNLLSIWANGQFDNPQGITLDENGNVYVTDTSNDRVQIFDGDGNFIRKWGEFGYAAGQLSNPRDILVKNGIVYITDDGDRVQKFDVDGNYIAWDQPGIENYSFSVPLGMTADNEHIYIADSENHRIVKFTSDGEFVTVFGEKGTNPGFLNTPVDLALDSDGKIYVSDKLNNRIQVFEKITDTKSYKALIAAGGGPFPGNRLWDATRSCANFAYRTLTMRGFSKKDIFYLSEDTDIDLDNNGKADDVHGKPDLTNFTDVFTKIGHPYQMVIYLVDHGGDGIFRMNESENLEASVLSDMINLPDTEVIFVYDACRSGSFLPDFSPKATRTVTVSSSGAGEESYFIGQGSASFSNYFWMRIFNGDSVGSAFTAASQSVVSVTGGMQNPLLNGENADNLYIGRGGAVTGELPEISGITHSISGNILELSASVTSLPGISAVRATVIPDDYRSDSPEIPVLEMPTFELLPVPGENGHYSGTWNGFESGKKYSVFIRATDRNGNTTVSEALEISAGEMPSRKALLVLSANADDSVSLCNTAVSGRETLVFQGYSGENIQVLAPSSCSIERNANPDLNSLRSYLNSLNAGNTHNLTVWLAGEGDESSFSLNTAEKFTSSALAELLPDLPVTVICDWNYSGGFLPGLKGTDRILISSAPADGLTSDSYGFSAFFWQEIREGSNIRQAFRNASAALGYFNPVFTDKGPQTDDNGNGISNEISDGRLSSDYHIGLGIRLGTGLVPEGQDTGEQDTGEVPVTFPDENTASFYVHPGIYSFRFTGTLPAAGTCGLNIRSGAQAVFQGEITDEELTLPLASEGVYDAEISGNGCGSSGLEIFRPVGVFPGYIKGKITDADGNPLSGVKITVNGVFSFFSLPDGRFRLPWEAGSGITLRAEKTGYDLSSVSSLTVSEGGTAIQNFTLGKTVVTAPGTQPAAYILSPSGGTVIEAGQSLIFQGSVQSGDYPISYSWDFGNGQTSLLREPGEIIFPEPGIYTVFFRVRDADGDVSAASVTVTVNEKEEPVPMPDPDGNPGGEPPESADSGEPAEADPLPLPDADGNPGGEPSEPGNSDDGNPGTPEPTGPSVRCVETEVSTEICVRVSGENTGISGLKSEYLNTVFPSEKGPVQMPEGYITVQIGSSQDNPEISVNYSSPLPADAQWFRFDSAENEWYDETGNVTFSADRKSVTVRFTGGPPEDADGPKYTDTEYSGGYRSSRPLSPPSGPPSDDVGGDGCFIGTSAF